jgi:hypothetical protein
MQAQVGNQAVLRHLGLTSTAIQRVYLRTGTHIVWHEGQAPPTGYEAAGTFEGSKGKAELYVATGAQAPTHNGDPTPTVMKAHAEDRAALRVFLEAHRQSENRMLANTCEWLLTGRAQVYPLTLVPATPSVLEKLETADRELVEEYGAVVYFPDPARGTGHLLDNPPSALTAEHLRVASPTMRGWQEAGDRIAIPDVATRVHNVLELATRLRHEVQHVADRHEDEEPTTDVDAVIQQYKTEFRAHIYQSGEERGAPQGSGSEFHGHLASRSITRYGYKWNELQLKVFEQIFGLYEDVRKQWGYSKEKGERSGDVGGSRDSPRTKKIKRMKKPIEKEDLDAALRKPSEDESYRKALLDTQTFHNAVVSYRKPDKESINRFNSVRVDALYTAIKGVAAGAARTAKLTQEQLAGDEGRPIREALAALQPEDKQDVLGVNVGLARKMDSVLDESAMSAVLGLLSK